MATEPNVNQTTKNLAAIPFGAVIGSPLKAAIEAQGIAAKATVDFIQTVGFKPKSADPFAQDFDTPNKNMGDVDIGELRNITFKYKKITSGAKGNVPGDWETVSLTVPILTIIPIPYIRIDDMSIDFTANLSEVHTTEHKNSQLFKRGIKTDFRARTGWLWGGVSFGLNASFSSTHSSSSQANSTYNTEYTMNVNLRAVQDDIPAGLAKMLEILRELITDKPAASG